MNKDDTIAIIRSLLTSSTASFTISKLNKEFKNETGMDIPLFGYSNISNFLQSIPHVVKLTGIYPVQQVLLVTNEKSGHIASLVKRQRIGKQQKIIANPNKHLKVNPRFTSGQEWQSCVRKRSLHDSKGEKNEDQILESSSLTCMSDYVCTCQIVCPIDVKLHASVGKYIEVCPCEIINPQKFYFHFRKFRKKIEDFMSDLQMFYDTHTEIPKISANLISAKQLCAVSHKINGKMQWCRAEIENILNEACVTVILIDFGSSIEISRDKLKFLHRNFISLPKQACVGFLANIKPVRMTQEWSSSAIRRFYDLAFEKDLVAGVVCIDVENCALGMALSFTKGPEIHINDTLVTEGHAVFEMKYETTAEVEDNTFNKLKPCFDENKHYTDEISHLTNYSKKFSNESLIQSDFQNDTRTNVQIPIFYASNIYNSNSRLKKMFFSI